MLERINKTNDIKKLNYKEKIQLSDEIRDYIVDITSKNGGHLASNLGIVEITLALESVFDVNKDRIVWDVGHQCYTHKILNGRKDSLVTLRKYKGVSGFPKVCESKTDAFNTGHSSTSIGAAMGMAKARDLLKEDYNVIAVIGDGALTGGMALEALNHVGSTKTKMIIVLNDNEMSISPNISGINELLTNLRSKRKYRRLNEKLKKFIVDIPGVGKYLGIFATKIKNSIKQLFIPGMYFEEIGIRYLGPVDGHNIKDLESVFEKAKNFDDPVLIHCLTNKGQGYEPALKNPDKFHGVSAFDKDTGKSIKPKSDDYSKIFGKHLVKLAEKNDKIVAITAAMKDGTGLFDFADKFPDRFFDVGIAEQHALTFSAGLASQGIIPFVSIYSSFYQRGYDQVIHDICAQNLHVIMCVDRAGAVGADGETHQGLFDMSFFKLVPNLTIMCPADFKELRKMMDMALSIKGPVVIRYPRGGESKTLIPYVKIEYGKANILKEGNEISIIAIGNQVSKAVDVANLIDKDIEIIDVRFLKPLDKDTIINSIKKTKNVIIIEDNIKTGGLASSIKDLIVENSIDINTFRSYSYPDKFINHGSIDELEKENGLDIQSIVNDIKDYFK